MKEIRGKLIERIKRTSDVESFRFILEDKVDFLSGQFLEVIFDEENKNNKELNKYLSISSSSTRSYVEVTKKLSSSEFSYKLKELKIADNVLFKIPLGSCVFKEEYKKIGFLIGGIGITPVISIIEYIIDKKLPTDIIVLYSNLKEEDIAFRKELDKWQQDHINIKVFYTITDCYPENKDCLSGFINKKLLVNKVRDLKDRRFFIFGPPAMVNSMQNLCLDTGCEKEKLKTESFLGY